VEVEVACPYLLRKQNYAEITRGWGRHSRHWRWWWGTTKRRGRRNTTRLTVSSIIIKLNFKSSRTFFG